jgi:hypothetical protein
MRRFLRELKIMAAIAALAIVTAPAGSKVLAQRETTPGQPGPGQPGPAQPGPGTQKQTPTPRAQQQPRGPSGPAHVQPHQPGPQAPTRAQEPRRSPAPQQVQPTQPQPQAPTRAQEQRQPAQPGATTQTQPGSPSTRATVQLSTEQRTRVRQIVINQGPRATARVNFDIRIGARVPRSEVRLFPLPVAVVEIVPAYQGYLYFYDEEEDVIVVVHPVTFEIVAILPA